MIHSLKTESLDVRIFENRNLMGEEAAKLVSEKIRELLAEQEYVNMIFAAAPSQDEFHRNLCKSTDIDWNRINAFHMDEYLRLPQEAPQAFGNFLQRGLFSKLPFRAVYYINGNADDITRECARYSELLHRHPADIVCMGIGENGHIAFNDPPVADFNDQVLVKEVTLDNECRQQQVNDGCFSNIDQVPENAITLTIPALMGANFIYCIVPGQTKAQAVFNTLNMDIKELYPSTILRRHLHAVLFLDQHSSRKL